MAARTRARREGAAPRQRRALAAGERPRVHSFVSRTGGAVTEVARGCDALLCVEAGELLVGWRGRTVRAPRGSLVVLPAGERLDLHGVAGIDGFKCDSLPVCDTVAERFEQQHRSLVGALSVDPVEGEIVFAKSPETVRTWQQLMAAFQADAPLAMIEHRMQALLLQMALEGQQLPLAYRRHLPLHRRVQRLLEADPAHAWTVAEIAAILGMSEPTLRRRLAANACSFRGLLEDVRMARAMVLLTTGNQTIAEISHAVGYSSPSRFSVRFRVRHGISPRMVRDLRSDVVVAL